MSIISSKALFLPSIIQVHNTAITKIYKSVFKLILFINFAASLKANGVVKIVGVDCVIPCYYDWNSEFVMH